MTRIYISAMGTLTPEPPTFNPQAVELLKNLQEEGFQLFGNPEWREYEIIEREIASCDALLAIVDWVWQSSTWMASEVTRANGHCGSIVTPNTRISPIPIFLYPILEREKWGWLRDYAGPTILERDVRKAVLQIKSRLYTTDQ